MSSVQCQEYLGTKYSFQERNQHKRLVSRAIFTLEYWLLEVLPLPVLNIILAEHSYDIYFCCQGYLKRLSNFRFQTKLIIVLIIMMMVMIVIMGTCPFSSIAFPAQEQKSQIHCFFPCMGHLNVKMIQTLPHFGLLP